MTAMSEGVKVMRQEIERKFLVRGDGWRGAATRVLCRQGYLLTGTDCTVRVRVLGDEGFLTIKGRADGLARTEYEYPIPVADAHHLLDWECARPFIEKYRHCVMFAGRRWEIDEFLGENAGLIVAEIELESADQAFESPDWVGQEVSDDPRYCNSNLGRDPYCRWGAVVPCAAVPAAAQAGNGV